MPLSSCILKSTECWIVPVWSLNPHREPSAFIGASSAQYLIAPHKKPDIKIISRIQNKGQQTNKDFQDASRCLPARCSSHCDSKSSSGSWRGAVVPASVRRQDYLAHRSRTFPHNFGPPSSVIQTGSAGKRFLLAGQMSRCLLLPVCHVLCKSSGVPRSES